MRGKPSKRQIGPKGRKREVWYVEWPDPLTGKRRQQTFETKHEAQRAQDALNAAPKRTCALNPLVDPNIDLETLSAEWLWRGAVTGTWRRAGTATVYRDQLRRVLDFRLDAATTLGQVRVRDLTGNHVEAFVAGSRAGGFSASTVTQAFRLFSAVLDRAVGLGLLPRHPVDRDTLRTVIRPMLRGPKHGEQVKALSEDQTKLFLATAEAHSRFHKLYALLFLAGVRIGEALGLQLDDDRVHEVDGRRVRQLHVSRTLNPRSVRTVIVGPTKNGQARTVDVGASLGQVLDQIRAERPRLALKHNWRPVPGWVFLSSAGTPYDQRAVGRDFKRVLRLAGLDDTFSAHSAKHSFACAHIRRKCSAKWLQQQMGHSGVGVTLDTYAHWFKLVDSDAADAFGSALLGNGLATAGSR